MSQPAQTLSPLQLLLKSLILVPTFMLVVANAQVPATLVWLQETYTFNSLGLLLVLVGANVGLFFLLQMTSLQKSSLTRQLRAQKKAVDAEVTAEVADARVKALEAKIETLEKALSKALKSGNTEK